MTRTRTSVLLTALVVVAMVTAGYTGAVSTQETQSQTQADDGLSSTLVSSGEVYWQGQFLRLSAGQNNSSEVWSIRQVENGNVGELATEVLLGSNGTATISTARLDGQYVVVDEDGDPVVFQNGDAQSTGSADEANFEVTVQELEANFSDSTVTNDDSPNARTDLQLSSNRAGYGVYLFSDQMDASQLADVFPAAEVRDGRAVVTRNVSSDEALDANFTGVSAGTYNVTVFTSDGTAQDTAAVSVVEPTDGTAALENDTVVEQRGDVARFNVTFDGTDRATVRLGSEEVGYLSEFTVLDEDGDGTATVTVNTFTEGTSANRSGVSAVGEDTVSNYQLVTDPLPDQLDAASYPIRVSVGQRAMAVGVLNLVEPSTGTMQVWTAPDRESVGDVGQITQVAAQDDSVAYQDWAIVQVEASGLYGYVQNLSDLNDNETGVSMNVTRVGEVNVPSESVSLDQANLILDENNDQLFLVMDTNSLERNATYRVSFNVTAENPYVEAGNGTSLTTNFTVVPRNVSVEDAQLNASSDATVSGTSSLAPGTEFPVVVQSTNGTPFIDRSTATVADDGTWTAEFDLSEVEPDTGYSVEVEGFNVSATGTVGGDGAAEAAEETETPETTPAEEDETEAAEAAETTTTPAEDEEDGAVEETETAEEDGTAEETETEVGAAEEEETETTTTETTTTETTTTTTEAEAGDGADGADGGDGGDGGIPGFGIGVALLAILGAALLALRRSGS